MKSFKDYESGKTEKSAGAGTSVPQDGVEEFVKSVAAKYAGQSGLEMMSNIVAEAESAKRSGTLTNEQIDGFYAQFSPMLNGFQRKKLDEIVKRLKEI